MSSTLRVLSLLPGITPDAGAEQSMSMLLPIIRRHGVEVHLGLLTERQDLAPALQRAGVVVHDLSASRSTITRANALLRLLRTVQFDLVHATLFEAAVPAQLAAVRSRTPVLVTWANTSYTRSAFAEMGASAWRLRVVQIEEVLLARIARTRFHAVTPGVATVNGANLRVRDGLVAVGERGREPALLDICQTTVDRLRSELVPAGSRLVLAVGRQEPQKGYASLLAAFDEVASRYADVRLVVAGREGSDTPRLTAKLATLRHGDRVRFLGHRDDIPALLRAADVVACASLREGAAGALIEAMGCGTPIVTVRLDGLDGVIVDGHNGIVVERRDLVAGLSRALDDDDLRRSLADAGRDVFAARFTLDRSAQRLAEIYSWAAGRNAVTRPG